jgi:hypothetical protein
LTKEERNLLLSVALIMLANHNSSGADANRQRAALREALSPFKAAIEALDVASGASATPLQHVDAKPL